MESYQENNKRNWSDLISDPLNLISKNLPDITDFIRFRTVCKPWRSSTPTSDLLPQLPWLVLKQRDNENLRFYSISSKKIYTIQCPSSRDKHFEGAYSGSMLACRFGERATFSLLNPITKTQVRLPNANLLHPVPRWISSNRSQGIEYVVISGTSISDNNPKLEMLAFCRPNDEEWVYINCGQHLTSWCAIYQGKLFHIHDITRATHVTNMATQTYAYTIPPLENERSLGYFVESAGELLRIIDVYGPVSEKQTRFHIYKLDGKEGDNYQPTWIKMSNIGDQVIFIGRRQGISFKASDFEGFERNCIYHIYYDTGDYSVCRYNIEDETTEELCHGLRDVVTWFVPTLV